MRGAALLMVALALVLAPAASAAPILAPADATELVETLSDAQEAQGVCYGWAVTGDADSTGSSSLGPDRPVAPDAVACPRGTVELVGEVIYECSTCESGDSVSLAIRSTLARPPNVGDLSALGLDPSGLAGDNDDEVLFDLVSALPLAVAEKGQAPFVGFETPAAAEVSAADRPTGGPGSDTLRAILAPAGLGLFLMVCGVGYFFYKRGQIAR